MSYHRELDSFLSGHRLGFVGVSISATCPTRSLFLRLLARGHEVIPIRPGVSAIEGITAYPSVLVAGPLDGVVLMTSRRNAERALEDCHLAGVRRVWLVGDDARGEARAYAARHSIELVVLSDSTALVEEAPGLLRRITGRLHRITSITHRISSAPTTREA